MSNSILNWTSRVAIAGFSFAEGQVVTLAELHHLIEK